MKAHNSASSIYLSSLKHMSNAKLNLSTQGSSPTMNGQKFCWLFFAFSQQSDMAVCSFWYTQTRNFKHILWDSSCTVLFWDVLSSLSSLLCQLIHLLRKSPMLSSWVFRSFSIAPQRANTTPPSYCWGAKFSYGLLLGYLHLWFAYVCAMTWPCSFYTPSVPTYPGYGGMAF